MSVSRFEDLIAWQKARALTRGIYLATQRKVFARDFGLRDQVRRAAVSIMSNIAERFERSGCGGFHQFLSVAKGSCGELRAQSYIALDAGCVSSAEFEALLKQASEVSAIIGGQTAGIAR